mgnify:CR=1 FL=1
MGDVTACIGGRDAQQVNDCREECQMDELDGAYQKDINALMGQIATYCKGDFFYTNRGQS